MLQASSGPSPALPSGKGARISYIPLSKCKNCLTVNRKKDPEFLQDQNIKS
jgi:hypothetical protein